MGIYTTKRLLDIALMPFRENKKIGFVPTMGALHSGHLQLVKRALVENDGVVVSIFVNPTQFNNAADLKKYPRTLENDVTMLSSLKGNVFIYAPDAEALYDGNVISKKYNFSGLEHEMEGKHRNGHFDGVGTVLNILFRNVEPNRAYFGEKDFQQLQIVRKLVEVEKLPVDIIGCEIVREENGLAKSSRNKRLNEIQKKEAAVIYRSLTQVKEQFKEKSIAELNAMVVQIFSENEYLQLEYFEIANAETLQTAQTLENGNKYRAFIAAFAGNVRLIDNVALN